METTSTSTVEAKVSFLTTYRLKRQDVLFVPYGSRVYGTASKDSDEDYIVIVPNSHKTGEEYWKDNVNVHIFNKRDFQEQLNNHKIHALEAYFLPYSGVDKQFSFALDLSKLRSEISAKASNSFVKAKKKLEVEKDYYLGWKSLFHSLRILVFGKQIASEGKFSNYSAANRYWLEIRDAQQYNWQYFKDMYQPVYNNLATEFRKVAPKELENKD